MRDDRNSGRGDYKPMEEGPRQVDDDAQSTTRPVATTLLFSSNMLNEMNLCGPETAGTTNPSSRAPNPPIRSASDVFLEGHERNVSSASGGIEVELEKQSEAAPSTNASSVTSNRLAISGSLPLQKITGAATKIKKMSKIGEAVNVIADFIPVVGNSGASKHYSRLRKTGQPIDSVNADELAAHPLHKACALSVSPINTSTTSVGGGDLASIKQLVESDPSQLHKQLPTSGDTPLHIAIRFGATQWHQMFGDPSNLAVIEFLIQAEIGLRRREAMRQRTMQGEKSPICVKSLILETSLYRHDNNNDLPIHVATAEGFEGAVRILLKVDRDAGFGSVVMSGGRGNLPLHFAVLRDDIALVQLLIAADRKRMEQKRAIIEPADRRRHFDKKKVRSIVKQNNDGDLPLHLAFSSRLKFALWDALLEPDTEKETLHIQNLQGIDAFHFFSDQPDIFKNEKEFVDAHLGQALLQRLLSGKSLDPWENHLKRSVARSREMQLMMNNAAANRLPVMIFMADFYAHVLSILALFLGTDYYLLTGGKDEAVWLAEVIFAMVAYFSGREFIQLLLSKSLYWTDFWNYMDLVRICMLVMLALILQADEAEDFGASDEQYTKYIRRFLVALAVFMFLGLLSFLRITYLQFALFVGGTAQIVITLIPFMVTFLLVLGLFAYGYWVGGFESSFSEGEQTWGLWCLELFVSSLNGPEGLASMDEGYIHNIIWTVLFVILAQVFLLNVLIAVITSAWEEITDRQQEVFWKYRLEYTAGVLPIAHFLSNQFGGTCLYRYIASMSVFIDSLEDKPIVDAVDWNVSPYSKVIQDRSLYWDHKRFQEAVFKDSKARHDTQRTWRGGSEEKEDVPVNEIREAWRKMRSFEADVNFAKSGLQRMHVRMQKFGFYALWCVSAVAGFATLGFCWPRVLRRFFCAPSTTTKVQDELTDGLESGSIFPDVSFLDKVNPTIDSESANDRRFEAMEKKIDAMRSSVETLQQSVEALVRLQLSSEERQKTD